MGRYAYGHFFAALALASLAGSGPVAASAKRHGATHVAAHHHHHHIVHRANQAASAGDRHPAHPATTAHKAFGAPVWEPPQIASPYPYSGKLAGDGVLHTGWLDSNVMRAWGVILD